VPATYGIGFTLERADKWLIGADFTSSMWSKYRFFGEKDALQDSWMAKIGGQFIPNAYAQRGYFNHATYRLGYNFGRDYINVDKSMPVWNVTAGAGFPVRKNPYTNQYTSINVALEYGKRGNNENVLRESYFRVAIGLSLSDLWFVKRKYD
jgi:hypothetical protein